MAYPPRLFHEGFWYHVYTRGQRQEPLFFAPIDRIAYLSFLDAELSRRGGWVGGYCLMTNHLHLLIKMGPTDLGDIFRDVHSKYARWFNDRRETVGHVFQGRPGMKIILDEAYLRQIVPYIHHNPVEADLVESPKDWEWSFWDWFEAESPIDLHRGIFPPGFDDHRPVDSVDEMTSGELAVHDGANYWGTEEEWQSLEKRESGREGRKFRERRDRVPKDEIVQEVLRGSNHTLDRLRSPDQSEGVTALRREAMSRMYEEGYGPTEIGKYFNRTKGAVTHAYQKWLKK